MIPTHPYTLLKGLILVCTKTLILATLTLEKLDFSYTNFRKISDFELLSHFVRENPDLSYDLVLREYTRTGELTFLINTVRNNDC